MKKIVMLAGIAGFLFVLVPTPSRAGLFKFTPQDYAYGPYSGGHGYSYATAYHYQLPFGSGNFPDVWTFPHAAGHYPYAYSLKERRPTLMQILRRHRQRKAQPSCPLGLQPVPPDHIINPAPAESQPARICVHLPADAEVWIDGIKTNQTGPYRTYHTPALPAGKVLHYEVKARWVQAGQLVEQTRSVFVPTGGEAQVNFVGP